MESHHPENARINNNLPVAREGLPFIFAGCALTLLSILLSFIIPAIILGLITLFIIYFFRDPERGSQVDDRALLTPADGVVLDIQLMEGRDNPLGEPSLKISIFMSVFNVHVNRIPYSGKILKIIYNSGKFLSANLDKASSLNENNRILLETTDGKRIMIIQIAGLIARRIACWIKEGDQVAAGQRFGLIRFGSRVDIYLPPDSRIVAQPKAKVKAGETILGYLP